MDAPQTPVRQHAESLSGVIDAWLDIFRAQKRLADRAITQLSDAQLHQPVAPGTNPVAVIMQHMAGNMRSRWTGFLTSDGEKPDRNREGEFADCKESREQLMQRWEAGWKCVFDALAALLPDDLDRRITIRAQPHTIPQAVNRQIDHYAYHVGQIVLIARILAGDQWQYLSIPPGASERFNEEMQRRHGTI